MTIDSREFRQTLGHFATGITVVTTQVDQQLFGFTANAFASVSLDPPLVLVCVTNTSNSIGAITASGMFCVNVLTADQSDLARCFANSSPEKYAQFCGATYRTAVTGAPVLDGALAWVDCRLSASYPGGDHQIIVGEVVHLGTSSGSPLLYYRGNFFGDEVVR